MATSDVHLAMEYVYPRGLIQELFSGNIFIFSWEHDAIILDIHGENTC